MNQPVPPQQTPSPQLVREDIRRLRKTLFRLSMPYLLRRVAILAIGIIAYLLVAKTVLGFGADVSYDKWAPADTPLMSLLNRINIYLWWALVVILGIVTFFWLKSVWGHGVSRTRAVPVPATEVRMLAGELSAPVLDVMRWVWSDRSDPFSLGDLQRTLAETRAGRIDKLRTISEQQTILEPRVA